MSFFGFFQVFQSLFQLNNLTQMNQWNILHANQPSVPEATPAPGFERFMPAHRADQRVPTSTAQGKGHKALVILHKRTNFKFRHTRSCCPSLSKAEKTPRLLRNLISFCISAVAGVPQMSYLEHLTNEEDEFDNIFNGAPNLPDYAVFNLVDLENGKRLISCLFFPFCSEHCLDTPLL